LIDGKTALRTRQNGSKGQDQIKIIVPH